MKPHLLLPLLVIKTISTTFRLMLDLQLQPGCSTFPEPIAVTSYKNNIPDLSLNTGNWQLSFDRPTIPGISSTRTVSLVTC
ncbi:hypothetical protein J6590_036384 [Homalodisca vitripennis]|nr:hypothetical protein J6590_036384 [Homalodisca vitripennis]